MQKNVTLTTKQLAAVKALTACADITTAAAEARVSRQTLYRWMQMDTFNFALNLAVTDSLNELSRRLVQLGGKAARTLELALEDDEASTSTKVQAANVILSRLLDLRQQHDLETRILFLEEKLLG